MSSYVLTMGAQGVSIPYAVQNKKAFWGGVAGIGLIVNFTGTTNPTTGAASGAAAVATATVQISSDPAALDNPNGARWIAHPALTGVTTDAAAAQEFPITAIRLVLTAWTSGVVALQICNVNNI